MERSTPVRKSHTPTPDLLTWPETPSADATPPLPRSAARSHQPSDGISKVVFGGQVTDEEVESLLKRKPCSEYKMKEITGSGIFAAHLENEESESNPTPSIRTGSAINQAAAGISQISFDAEDIIVSPKKPTSVAEVAKLRELSGTIESEEGEMKTAKPVSEKKTKEISGHDIFGPPPEFKVRPLHARSAFRESKDFEEPAIRNGRVSVKDSNVDGVPSNGLFAEEPVIKTAKKIPNQKFVELSGNDIFKGDAPPSTAEKQLSMAKLREISGNDIFADRKVESRDYFGGVRKPPGGGSSIALV